MTPMTDNLDERRPARRRGSLRGHPNRPTPQADPDGLGAGGRDALEAFVAHLRDERGLSAHTVAAYRRDLTQFLEFAGRAGVTDPARVEPLLLRRFLALQRTRGLAAASIARKGAALRAGFRFLARRGLVPDDPAPGSGSPGPKRLPVVLKPARSTGCSPDPSRSTRWACATGRSSSCCTRPGSGSGSCAASASATSTWRPTPSWCSARAPRSGSCRSGSRPAPPSSTTS